MMKSQREDYSCPETNLISIVPTNMLCVSGEGTIDGMGWGDEDITGITDDVE